jgi:hypothetical protein
MSILNYPLIVRHAALCIWADAFWRDLADDAMIELHGEGVWQNLPRDILERPNPPMPEDYVEAIGHVLSDTEKAWGKTIHEISEMIDETPEDIAFSVVMGSVGHGVGCSDYHNWPKNLLSTPVHAENPAYEFLPDVVPFIESCVIEDHLVRDYSNTWGSDHGDGPLFYNFGSGHLGEPKNYERLMGVIDTMIEKEKAAEIPEGFQRDADNLVRLYNRVLWEGLNKFGPAALSAAAEKIYS